MDGSQGPGLSERAGNGCGGMVKTIVAGVRAEWMRLPAVPGGRSRDGSVTGVGGLDESPLPPLYRYDSF